jgi:hypothetical protein
LEQLARLAASRADCTAGRSRPISVAMIAITQQFDEREASSLQVVDDA